MSGIRADAVFRAASSRSYGYDAAGVLVHCQSTDQTAWRFWRGGTVANELRTTAGGDTRIGMAPAAAMPAYNGEMLVQSAYRHHPHPGPVWSGRSRHIEVWGCMPAPAYA